MSFRISRLVAVLALSSAAAGTAQAQTGAVHLGPRASYQFDLEKIGLGAQLSVPIARQLEFYPSFDYFFVDVGSFWNLNADLKYRIATRDINWLYLGGGLNVARRSFNNNDNTGAGINAFVGAESRAGRVHPFAEFRFTSNDGSTAQLSVGLNFTLRQ
ncbi:MAG TPA: hypothetical protein VMK53_03830 [Gemmatimonadales bacterium]|nr:hypothetical protein [Gemmatimonadales bacterium]